MIKTSTTLKTMELKFKLGEPFDETTPDGREVTAVCTLEEGQKSTKSVREMNGADELIYTMTIDGSDIVCAQKFKRVLKINRDLFYYSLFHVIKIMY